MKTTTMTAATAKGCLASRHFLGRLNELKRVNGISQPILRGTETPMKAGKIELLNPGYDEASGIFTRGNRVAVERMPLADAVRQGFDQVDRFAEHHVADDVGRATVIQGVGEVVGPRGAEQVRIRDHIHFKVVPVHFLMRKNPMLGMKPNRF
jgi:hypothetical protein